MLFNAGDHVPEMPLLDVSGKAVNGVPEQMGATGVKVGVVEPFTAIVTVSVTTQLAPLLAVNVYVVVEEGQTVGVNVLALVMPVVGDQLKVGSRLLNEILQLFMVPKSPPASS